MEISFKESCVKRRIGAIKAQKVELVVNLFFLFSLSERKYRMFGWLWEQSRRKEISDDTEAIKG